MHANAMYLAIMVAFLWAITPLAHKVFMRDVSPESLMLANSIIYLICAVAYYLYRRDKIHDKGRGVLEPRMLAMITAIAVFAAFLPNIIFLYLLRAHESHVVTSFAYISPLFTVLLAYIILKEHVTPSMAFGVFLTVIGVVFMLFSQTRRPKENMV